MRLKCAVGFSAVVLSIVVVGSSLAGEAVQSGLKIGDPVMPFLVDDITGPNKGKTLCYR
jgi:predicted transporter